MEKGCKEKRTGKDYKNQDFKDEKIKEEEKETVIEDKKVQDSEETSISRKLDNNDACAICESSLKKSENDGLFILIKYLEIFFLDD